MFFFSYNSTAYKNVCVINYSLWEYFVVLINCSLHDSKNVPTTKTFPFMATYIYFTLSRFSSSSSHWLNRWTGGPGFIIAQFFFSAIGAIVLSLSYTLCHWTAALVPFYIYIYMCVCIHTCIYMYMRCDLLLAAHVALSCLCVCYFHASKCYRHSIGNLMLYFLCCSGQFVEASQKDL